MGRKLEFEPEEALKRVMTVFWERGYERTSVDDLESATGVGRKSLYRTFNHKRDLFIRALDVYRDVVGNTLVSPLYCPQAGVVDIKTFLFDIVRFCNSSEGARGCLICNTAMEVLPDEPEIIAKVRDYFAFVRGGLKSALQRARERGEIDLSDEALEREVNVLFGAVQGIGMMTRTTLDRAGLEHVAAGAVERLERYQRAA